MAPITLFGLPNVTLTPNISVVFDDCAGPDLSPADRERPPHAPRATITERGRKERLTMCSPRFPFRFLCAVLSLTSTPMCSMISADAVVATRPADADTEPISVLQDVMRRE